MLDPFSAVFTCGQIVKMAERRANNPGFNLVQTQGVNFGLAPTNFTEMLDAPAYAELQMILDQLALVENFTFTRQAIDFYINARINSLPTWNNGAVPVGYWRIGFSDPAWLMSVNDPALDRSRIAFLDAEQFHARFHDGETGRPTVAYINRSNGTILVDPAPDQLYVMEIHCYPWQAALVDPTTRPWFPYSEYLVEALLTKLYLALDDSRRQDSAALQAAIMKRIKQSLGDERDHASASLTLDPVFYRRPIEL